MGLVGRRGWWLGLLVVGAWQPVGAVPAVLCALHETEVQWQLREPASWATGQAVQIEPGGWGMVVDSQSGQVVKARLSGREALDALVLGGQWDLTPTEAAIRPLATVQPTERLVATVIGLHDGQLLLQAPRPPDLTQTAEVEGRPGVVVTWTGAEGRRWQAQAAEALPIGTRVVYQPAAAGPAAPAVAPTEARRPLNLSAEGTVVPGDDPLYDRFAALAAAGFFPGSTARQFRGDPDGLYTRGQFADFVAQLGEQLLDRGQLWPVQESRPALAAQVEVLLDEFSDELAARGIDAAAASAALPGAVDHHGYSGFVTGRGTAWLGSGDDALGANLRASYHGLWGDRLQFDVAGQARSRDGFHEEYDRTNLVTLQARYRASRHLTFGLGRVSTRFGPGRNDLLWSDYAKPLDQFSLAWRTRWFGRPFSITQHTGLFDEGGSKYVTVRRFEFGPADRVTLGVNFGLITNKGRQALVSTVLPLYAARFTSGSAARGGDGNLLGSFDASWQISSAWQIYGQFFADDFDFSPSPPTTAQRIGFLAGLHYTPRRALPGTSYRLEATLIPDRGTYVGQQDEGLAWLRNGRLFGHPYGQDAAGVRLDIRQRLTPRWDFTLRGEHVRQLRSYPVESRWTRLDLATWYDLSRWVAVGLGGRYLREENRGGIYGNDRNDSRLFVETQAGF